MHGAGRHNHDLIDNTHLLFRMATRLFLIAVAVSPMVLASSGCFPDFLKDDKTEVATILERAICDRIQNTSHVLMKTDDRSVTYYSDVMGRLVKTTAGRVSIDDSLDSKILAAYPERVYVVKVRLCIEQTTKKYLVDRNTFNLLRVGVITKFVMNESETAIDSLIAY